MTARHLVTGCCIVLLGFGVALAAAQTSATKKPAASAAKIARGRYLAQKIDGAKFVELAGRDHPIWTGDVDRVVDEIEEFVTGARPAPDHDRVLATILVTRLVAPERLAAQLGDRHWGERIDRWRNELCLLSDTDVVGCTHRETKYIR